MMSAMRRSRLQQKLRASRERLLREHPFYGLLSMYLRFIAIPTLKKVSTDGDSLYFSADFIEKLHDDEVDYLLSHQILHILLGHIEPPSASMGAGYHAACDILVNRHLAERDMLKERYKHLGHLHPRRKEGSVQKAARTPKEIMGTLPHTISPIAGQEVDKFLPDEDTLWGCEEAPAGEVILDITEEDGALIENTVTHTGGGGVPQKWMARVVLAANADASHSQGGESTSDVPEHIARMLRKMREPTVDWKKLLNTFVREQLCDYSFTPPDRRFSDTDFFLPDFNEKDESVKEILFMVDTSASVSDNELAAVYSELCGAVEQFGGKLTGRLGFFDTQVTPPRPFSDVDELMRIRPYGGGNTDFHVIFHYLRHTYPHATPSCLVIFTDGCAPYPPVGDTMDIPVLWVIHTTLARPPFGKVAYLPRIS